MAEAQTGASDSSLQSKLTVGSLQIHNTHVCKVNTEQHQHEPPSVCLDVHDIRVYCVLSVVRTHNEAVFELAASQSDGRRS